LAVFSTYKIDHLINETGIIAKLCKASSNTTSMKGVIQLSNVITFKLALRELVRAPLTAQNQVNLEYN